MGASNIVRLLKAGLVDSEAFDLESGEALNVVPAVDDQGSVIVGNATKAMDLKWYGTTATSIATFDAGSNQLSLAGVDISSNAAINTSSTMAAAGMTLTGALTPSGSGYVARKALVTEATTALTVNATHFDSMILLANSSETTVTLPAPAAGNAGAKVTVLCGTNAAHVISSANTIIGLGSIVADTATAAETDKTGQSITLESTGAKWAVTSATGAWTITAG